MKDSLPPPMEHFEAEEPQLLMRPIPEGEEYPVEALGPLREAVEAVHDKTQAPIAIAAQSALSVVSLAVQGFANVQTPGGEVPASLFCLTIAVSGERKSGCDRLLMAGLRGFEADAAQTYRSQFADHDAARKLWEAKQSRLIKEASGVGEKATGALADLDAMPSAPEAPLNPNRTATDPTIEGLIKLYATGNPALGLFTDEGGSFFGGHAMNTDNKLKTCSGLSSLWDGSPINRTRAGDGASTMYGRRLAAHMMAQPIAVRPLLADPIANGQGFLARFLITEPQSNIGFRTRRGSDPKSDATLKEFNANLVAILRSELPMKEGRVNQLEPRCLTLTKSANELHWSYYEETELAQRPGGKLSAVTAHASKSAEQAVRIAAVLTLWEDQYAVEVSAEAMASGITLARFYLSEAVRLAEAAVISEKTEQAEKLRKWLVEVWSEPEVLPSDVVQNGPYALRETAKAKQALSILKGHGWVVALPEGTKVRCRPRTVAYRVVRNKK